MTTARASHDLNGITVIEIGGWRGPHEIKAHSVMSGWVTIEAPRRHPDEFWTFQAPRGDGILRCFTDLTGSPSLLTESAEPMVISLPAYLMDHITVRFAD